MSVLISFDVETTGLNLEAPSPSEVIQIGAFCLDQETLAPSRVYFERKLSIEHPERIAPNTLGVYNFYDPQVWAEKAVSQRQGWQDCCDWIFSCSGGGLVRPTLVGHNIAGFDYPLTSFWAKTFGFKPFLDYHTIDTVAVYSLFKDLCGIKSRGLGLADVCSILEVQNPKHHDALADAFTDGLAYALMVHYLRARIATGATDHKRLLDEAYLRMGSPRNPSHTPLTR